MARASDSYLRRSKAVHLKSRGDQALKAGNLKDAWLRYTEALAVLPDRESADKLHSNRSLAYCKAHRYGDALLDADAAVAAAPAWDKAHWRRGNALVGLKRMPEAVLAFRDSWRLSNGDAEVARALWEVVRRMTREQLGASLMAMFNALQKQGLMEPPTVEELTPAELNEGYFVVMQAAHRNKPRPGPYYHSFLTWLKDGLPIHTAYTERAKIYNQAKAYLQGRADAQAAVAAIQEQRKDDGSLEPALYTDLAAAYFALGKAFVAEKGHEDQDWQAATKAFTKGNDLNNDDPAMRSALDEAIEHLTGAQHAQVLEEVYQEANSGGGSLLNPLSAGILEAARLGHRIYRVDATLQFPQAESGDLGARARETLRRAVAAHAGLPPLRVMIDRVWAPIAVAPYLQLRFQVQLASDAGAGQRLVADLKEDPVKVIGGPALVEMLGEPNRNAVVAELVDATPVVGQSLIDQAVDAAMSEAASAEGAAHQERRIVAARPKMELELPYGAYRLVNTDGSLAERTDKHPFAMSRVYYSREELPQEVWAQMADGSCRWRQTGGELKIMALKVPSSVSPRALKVTIEPYHLKVEHKATQEVYLEGDLERGVVPEESFWTHGQGEADDGCVIVLYKMNLELLRAYWQHHEMWWPRLFKDHEEIAWDDYEKDYSDLPAEVLIRHKVQEAIKGSEDALENQEKKVREALQERDEVRKRTRQERLNALRSGTVKSWVQLNRGG